MKPKVKRKEYRSGLETAFQFICDKERISLGYETSVLPFVTPSQKRRYIPDWTIRDGWYIETKGRLVAADRKKLLLIKEQHPTVRLLVVFQRPQNFIYKKSPTTYGEWATKHGIEWCAFEDTKSWMKFIREGSK